MTGSWCLRGYFRVMVVISPQTFALLYTHSTAALYFSVLGGFLFAGVQSQSSPITACIQPFLLPVVQIYACHFLLGLDVIGLLRGNISEHAQCQFCIATQQSEVRISNSDTQLLRCSWKLIDGILHHLCCFVLKYEIHSWAYTEFFHHFWMYVETQSKCISLVHYFTCSPLSHRASANSKKTETQSAELSSVFLFLDLDEDPALRTPGRLMAICSVWIASLSSPVFFLVWALIRWYSGWSRIWNGQESPDPLG